MAKIDKSGSIHGADGRFSGHVGGQPAAGLPGAGGWLNDADLEDLAGETDPGVSEPAAPAHEVSDAGTRYDYDEEQRYGAMAGFQMAGYTASSQNRSGDFFNSVADLGDDEKSRRQLRRMMPGLSDEQYDARYSEVAELHRRNAEGQLPLEQYRKLGNEWLGGVDADLYLTNAAPKTTDPDTFDPEVYRNVKEESRSYSPGGYTGIYYDENRTLSDAQVGRKVRADLKKAQSAGFLPPKAKLRTRTEGGGMHTVYRVTAELPPGAYEKVHNTDRQGYSDYGVELRRRIETVAGAYGHNDSDSMTDYFDFTRTAHVEMRAEGYDKGWR